MSRINVRSKGQRGEREVVTMLQSIVDRVIAAINKEIDDEISQGVMVRVGKRPDQVQVLRNQLQSAVGGSDLSGIDWLAIEVKYQETENLNSWWAQTQKQTKPGQVGVLIHRANQQKWRVRMLGKLALIDGRHVTCPVDITVDAFLLWFENEFRSRATKI